MATGEEEDGVGKPRGAPAASRRGSSTARGARAGAGEEADEGATPARWAEQVDGEEQQAKDGAEERRRAASERGRQGAGGERQGEAELRQQGAHVGVVASVGSSRTRGGPGDEVAWRAR